MVHHGESEVGAADFAALGFQSGEGLRGSAFVDEVPLDVDEGGLAGFFVNEVVVPDFFVECFRRHRCLAKV